MACGVDERSSFSSSLLSTTACGLSSKAKGSDWSCGVSSAPCGGCVSLERVLLCIGCIVLRGRAALSGVLLTGVPAGSLAAAGCALSMCLFLGSETSGLQSNSMGSCSFPDALLGAHCRLPAVAAICSVAVAAGGRGVERFVHLPSQPVLSVLAAVLRELPAA